MNFNDNAFIIFESAKKELKKSKSDIIKEQKQIEMDWISKLDTDLSSISDKKIYDSANSVRDVIALAKEERKFVIQELQKYSIDSKKQLKLSKKLTNLNTLISSYEAALEEKENKKHLVGHDKKRTIINSMLNQLIENANKEIDSSKNIIIENSSKIAGANSASEITLLTDAIKKASGEMGEFTKLKESLLELQNYNGCVESDKLLNKLTDELDSEHADLVAGCYNLITSNLVNMKGSSTSGSNPSSEDAEKIEKINELLSEARANKDRSKLDEACELIKDLNDANLKNDLQAEVAEIDNIITEEEKYGLATAKVKEASMLKTKASVMSAEEEIDKLPDCDKKTELKEEIKEVKIIMFNEFRELLNNLKNKVQAEEDLSYDSIKDLSAKFGELIDMDDIENNKQIKYAKDVKELINVYNNQAQDRYKLEIAEEEPKKISLKDRIIEFGSSLVKWALGTKIARKFRQGKLKKAQESGNTEEESKIKNKIKKNDVVNGVRLFMARNKLAKIKPVLYKENILNINPDEAYAKDKNDSKEVKKQKKKAKKQYYKLIRKYYDAKNKIDKGMYNKLDDLTMDEDVVKDSERVLIVTSQFLKQLAVSDNFEEDSKVLKEFLEDALNAGTIKPVQYNSYMDEINSIGYYLAANPNSIYEVALNEINEEASKYYEKPVLYKDGDIAKALPHVKTYARK